MREKHPGVKNISAVLAVLLFSLALPAAAADTAAGRPHLVYFYNPSCRLCTGVNRAVADVEAKYKGQIEVERFNVADPEHGLDHMDSLFTMLDELGVPEDVSTLLTVVLGIKKVENGRESFIPMEILMEEDDIAANIDAMVANFIAKMRKGGGTLGFKSPADFFRGQRPRLDPAG